MKQVIKQIEPLDEDELEKDLRFLFNTRSETTDQFIEEAIPVIKYHLNQAMSKYQESLLKDLTFHMKNEIISVIVRSKRETIVEDDNDEW